MSSDVLFTPFLSLLLTSAPSSTRDLTLLAWPSQTASCSGVH